MHMRCMPAQHVSAGNDQTSDDRQASGSSGQKSHASLASNKHVVMLSGGIVTACVANLSLCLCLALSLSLSLSLSACVHVHAGLRCRAGHGSFASADAPLCVICRQWQCRKFQSIRPIIPMIRHDSPATPSESLSARKRTHVHELVRAVTGLQKSGAQSCDVGQVGRVCGHGVEICVAEPSLLSLP